MKLIYEARDPSEAQLVKGFLEAEEIRVIVQSGALGAVLGEMSASPETLPSVWVDEPDVDRARVIVDRFKSGELTSDVAASNWVCPRCGEALEGQFSKCWHCGTQRPAAV